MRTRKEIDDLIEEGLRLLETFPSLCYVTEELRATGYMDYIANEIMIDNEIKTIATDRKNKWIGSSFYLGKPNKNKKFRSFIWCLAIEKLYGEGKL